MYIVYIICIYTLYIILCAKTLLNVCLDILIVAMYDHWSNSQTNKPMCNKQQTNKQSTNLLISPELLAVSFNNGQTMALSRLNRLVCNEQFKIWTLVFCSRSSCCLWLTKAFLKGRMAALSSYTMVGSIYSSSSFRNKALYVKEGPGWG